MTIEKMHHVAYRCGDAAETAAFYETLLGLKFTRAIVQDNVPSTGAYYPHIHLFFTLADGSSIAFFELLNEPPAQGDPNTPDWVQHIAMEVPDQAALNDARQRLEDAGVEVIGTTDHGFCKSIYFFDPSGHRLELTIRNDDPAEAEAAELMARDMLDEWTQLKAGRRAAS